MKFTAKRLLAAGAIGISAIVTPIALAVALPGAGVAPSAVAGAQGGSDEILFNQPTSGGDNYQFLPNGGTASAPQAANISGNCATPTGGGPAILSVCGKVYSSPNYASTAKAANLGTNGPATGVGSISPAWTVDNKSNKGAEAIDFSPGSDTAVIGSGREFTDAQIPVQRKDTGNSGIGSVIVQLAEFDSSSPPVLLGTQNCAINGNTGTQITADPNNTAVCAVSMPAAGGGVPIVFQTIEVRDITSSTSISVVGPTAVFDLASEICGGQSIQPTNNGGNVTATLTLTGSPQQCKAYTSFSSTIDPNTGLPTLSFNGFSSTDVQLTVHIAWPAVPLCNPYVDVPGTTPGATTGIPDAPGLAQNMCPVHSFSFDGVNYFDQAYCQNAALPAPGVLPQQELCTVTKSYNNDTLNADGTVNPILTSTQAPGTQIVETWIGDIDLHYH